MSRRERIARERAGGEAPSASAPTSPPSPRPVIRPAERRATFRDISGPSTQPVQTVGSPPAAQHTPRTFGPEAAGSQPGGHPSAAARPAGSQSYPSDPRAAIAAAFAQPMDGPPAGSQPTAAHGTYDPAAAPPQQPEREQTARRRPEREPLGPVRATVRGFGELCITAGLILILFVVWQLWWTDIEANEDNAHLADQLTSEWAENPRNELPPDPETPVVAEPVDMNTAFGIMYIPRFGEDYYRTIAEGVSMEPVLNRMGLGRYPNAAMPGEVGNFALAGHRVTYGKPLNLIAELRPGDEIIVQTADGYYTYTFRNFDIVLPDATEVIAPVPSMPEFKGKDRILTLTACNPMFSARERYVAYAELTDWQPAAEGAPDSISASPAFAEATGGES
jgi:sortase A